VGADPHFFELSFGELMRNEALVEEHFLLQAVSAVVIPDGIAPPAGLLRREANQNPTRRAKSSATSAP